MLIELDDIVKKYSMNINGVLHIGAHECQELPKYLKYVEKNKIVWLEANPILVEKVCSKDPDLIVYQEIITDADGQEKILKIANSDQSSSILDFEKHSQDFPNIFYVGEFKGISKTVKTIYQENNIPETFANFLNIDIQGVELLALKGMGNLLENFDYLYLEINTEKMYKDCCLVEEIDAYVKNFGFSRVETKMWHQGGWGDALYIKN